jgi:hypothetical protein
MVQGSALAQEAPAEPAAQEPAAPPAAPVVENAAAQPAQPPAAPAVENGAAEADAEPAQQSRFRWGISGAGGPLMGGFTGGAGGVDLRFGMQMNSLLGIYAQPIFLVGAGAQADLEGASATALALYGVGALADVTLADLFYAGAGPELLFGGMGEAEVSTSSTSASASAATGPFFGIALRTGLAFGSMEPNRRQAFTLGLDMHVVFANEPAILPLIALGYESF